MPQLVDRTAFNDRSVREREREREYIERRIRKNTSRTSEEGQHSSDVREMGNEEDSKNASAEPSYTEEEKQKKNDKHVIRQLGYGLLRTDSLAFSNELFGGFLMHGKKSDVRIMKFVMLMSGMVICLPESSTGRCSISNKQDAPAPECAIASQYLTTYDLFPLI